MKKNNKIIFILLVSLISFVSCEDYLDVDPDRGIDTEVVYSDYYSYRGAIDRGNWLIVNYFGTFANGESCVGILSDERQVAEYNTGAEQANKGVWQDLDYWDFGIKYNQEHIGNPLGVHSSAPFHQQPAGRAMKAVRAMSIAINNIDLLDDFPAGTGYTNDELKNHLLGQAFALRAWHMFEVIRRYGPILLVDTTSGAGVEFNPDFNFDTKRPTFQQCADLIAKDCDEAIKLLPVTYVQQAGNTGRFTSATAASIKAMTYMYAASPLMNTDNGAFPFGQDTYNQEYAQKGIDATLEALSLINSSESRYKLYSQADYLQNWRCDNAVSDEALIQPGPTNKGGMMTMQWWNIGVGWWLPGHDGGWGNNFNMPTQNAVDRFETIDGYPVNGFSSDDPSFDEGNPYENRDPRLKMMVFCPNDEMYTTEKWINNTALRNEAWSNDALTQDFNKKDGDFVEVTRTGYHYNAYPASYTGYFDGGKWRVPGNNKFEKLVGSAAKYFIFPHIRVADMYLGLAELGNELYGPTTPIPGLSSVPKDKNHSTEPLNTAADALNLIRTRVGMPNVRSEFLNQDDFRDRVRNEWGVEYFGEFRRWKDIRRWRIAKDVLSKGIYGASIIKYDNGTADPSDDTFDYSSKKLDNAYRVFEDKHYWYPFPNGTKDMFFVFEQNPGW
ncbi:RagB/SusD family nutrient uptake outer membrane protein [Labilibacter marinus]|uniref:RagB/SusD family nutrient uptake outer membrane protein n=1 Tax=Labilibacter marinus TaxID=1477105 RepID=UPI00082A2E5E|nr:RagB/SusD family nutrient uptake outer membrane protein [Labilibacter marinus]